MGVVVIGAIRVFTPSRQLEPVQNEFACANLDFTAPSAALTMEMLHAVSTFKNQSFKQLQQS